MKEKYFDSQTIKRLSIQLLTDIQSAIVPQRPEMSIENSALLVLDMQASISKNGIQKFLR